MGRRRRLEKGKEMEGAEDEWRRKVEERLEGLEKVVTDRFREVMGWLGEVMKELVEVKELVDSEGLEGSEGSEEEEEEDGEGDAEKDGEEARDEEMVEAGLEVNGGVGTENGGDVEMVE